MKLPIQSKAVVSSIVAGSNNQFKPSGPLCQAACNLISNPTGKALCMAACAISPI